MSNQKFSKKNMGKQELQTYNFRLVRFCEEFVNLPCSNSRNPAQQKVPHDYTESQ